MLRRTCFLPLILLAASARAQTISMQGTNLIAQVMSVAKPILKDDFGIEIRMSTDGGSEGGFLAVGTETAQLGMRTSLIKPSERAQFPACSFDEVQIGWQVLVPAVAQDVWQTGIHSLTRQQIVGIYERDIRNWKEIGGPDEAIKFYNPKRGRGVWELFVTWLYTDQRLAPLGDAFETVVSYKDARDSVEFNLGSFSVMPPDFADGKAIRALGIREANGSITLPSAETLAAGKFPLARPLAIISGRRFAGDSKRLVDFLLTPRGQAIVKSVSFVPVREAAASIERPKPAPKVEAGAASEAVR